MRIQNTLQVDASPTAVWHTDIVLAATAILYYIAAAAAAAVVVV